MNSIDSSLDPKNEPTFEFRDDLLCHIQEVVGEVLDKFVYNDENDIDQVLNAEINNIVALQEAIKTLIRRSMYNSRGVFQTLGNK